MQSLFSGDYCPWSLFTGRLLTCNQPTGSNGTCFTFSWWATFYHSLSPSLLSPSLSRSLSLSLSLFPTRKIQYLWKKNYLFVLWHSFGMFYTISTHPRKKRFGLLLNDILNWLFHICQFFKKMDFFTLIVFFAENLFKL